MSPRTPQRFEGVRGAPEGEGGRLLLGAEWREKSLGADGRPVWERGRQSASVRDSQVSWMVFRRKDRHLSLA